MMPLARRYDLLNTALFLPWGGSRRLRRGLVTPSTCGPASRRSRSAAGRAG
jgi:hypothetical protein